MWYSRSPVEYPGIGLGSSGNTHKLLKIRGRSNRRIFIVGGGRAGHSDFVWQIAASPERTGGGTLRIGPSKDISSNSSLEHRGRAPERNSYVFNRNMVVMAKMERR